MKINMHAEFKMMSSVERTYAHAVNTRAEFDKSMTEIFKAMKENPELQVTIKFISVKGN